MKYALKTYNPENMARASVTDIGISPKVAIEISNMIRNKSTDDAKRILTEVIEKKRAAPYRRFNKDVGHKKAIGPGRFPVKASKSLLSLVKLVESNADNKSLGDNLKITHLVVNKGTDQWHFGRQRRRKMKRAHIEIAVTQTERAKKHALKHEEKKVEDSKITEKKAEAQGNVAASAKAEPSEPKKEASSPKPAKKSPAKKPANQTKKTEEKKK